MFTECDRCHQESFCEEFDPSDPGEFAYCPKCTAAIKAREKKRFTSTKATQKVLLTGLDCAAGQVDLFDGIDGAA